MTARHPDVMQHTPILDAYLEHLHTAVAERTWRQYRNVLLRAHRQLPQGVITATGTELRRWLAAQGRLTDTRRAYRQALTGLHRWLREQEITSHDPTVDLPGFPKPHRLPRPVPADQVAQLLAGAREPVRLWCQIMLYTGARCVELARLRREDMSAASVRLLGKGDRERLVPTHPALWRRLEPLPPGPVVRGPAAGNPSYLSELVAAECDRIGLGDVTAHRLRHTLATELLATTGDLRLVQEVLGHASPATTQVYTAVLVDRLSAAVRALPTWGSAAPEGGAGPGST